MRQNSGANYGRLHIKIRIVSLVLCIIMMLGMFPVNVFAADVIYSGYCGGEGDGTNLTWELDSDGLLTISGTGRMKDYNSYSDTPWSVRRSQINQVRVGDDVTSLDAEACWYLTEIEKVILGDGITELEASSFRKCKKLKTVVLGNNVSEIGGSAFDGCQSLTSFVVPDGATEIKSYTFNDCTNLEKVTIGNNVKTIGESSFQDCENLKRISFPDSVTKIESWAFNDCENLTEVIIGKGIEEIDVYAFYDCVSLTDVYYVGSEEEWNNISIGPVNGCFTGANVHFNYVRENEPPADAAEFNGHYYKVYSIDTSATGAEAWAEAKAHCEELGGYLAVISSQEENDFLLDYLLSVGETNAYFGFTDEAETGVWKWVDAPETSEYVNWATNEPNSRSEHYAMFYYGGSYFVNGEWNNGSFGNGTLDDDKNYICEWIGDDASTCPTVTNLQSSYTITEGDDLSLSFTVKAGGKDGLLNVVTVREPEADKQYYRQTDINAASLTVNITISDLSTGSHTLYVYATANNFTGDPVTGNNVIAAIEVTVEPLVAGIPENAQLYNGNKYYLYDKSMTWDEAKAYCEDLGGHLVTIADANEQAFLTSMVDGAAQNCYWIGATSTTGSWEWVTNEAFSYTNWKNAEPNNESGIENYAVMIAKEEGASQHGFSVKVGSWNDVSVTGHNGKKDNPFYSPDSLGFICEWEAASVKPTVTGLQSGYTLTEGQELSLNFSVKAGGTGLLNVVTIREPDADKQYYRQADINKAEHTVSTTISGLPVGLHKLVVYATATNFNGNPTNEIFEFTVTVNAKQEVPEADTWNEEYNPNLNSNITPELIERFLEHYSGGGLYNSTTKNGETVVSINEKEYSLNFDDYYGHSNTVSNSNPLSNKESAQKLTPAEIIYYSCVENDMNVVWMLANLQKEQSLITTVSTNYQARLNRAMGYMKMENGKRSHFLPGDKYYGFVGQVIGSSHQFWLSAVERNMSMRDAYESYTPSSETGNKVFDSFMEDFYNKYAKWFDNQLGIDTSTPEPEPQRLSLIVCDSNNNPLDLSTTKLISGKHTVVVDGVSEKYSGSVYIQAQAIDLIAGDFGNTVDTIYGTKISSGKYKFILDTAKMANATYHLAAFAWAADGSYVSSDYSYLTVNDKALYGFKLNGEWIENNTTISLTSEEAKRIEIVAAIKNNLGYYNEYINRPVDVSQKFSCNVDGVYNEEIPVTFSHIVTNLLDGQYAISLKLTNNSSVKIMLIVGEHVTIPDIEGNVFQQRWRYGENNLLEKPADDWSEHQYGYSNTTATKKATIGSSGCCLLSITNAVYKLNGNFIDPVIIADYAVENGLRINGVGSAATLPNRFAADYGEVYGFTSTAAKERPKDEAQIEIWINTLVNHLKAGGTAVVRIPGHYMSIVDWKSENGQDLFLLYDSEVSKNRKTTKDGDWKTSYELLTMNGPSSGTTKEYGVTRYYLIAKK